MEALYKTNNNRFAIRTIYVTALLLSIQLPASASWRDMLRNYLGAPGSGSGITSVTEAQTIANLNAERATIDAQISAKLRAGQLSPQQAYTFRAELQRFADLQASYSADGSLSYQEAANLVSSLNTLASNVQATTSVGTSGYPSYPTSYQSSNAQFDRMHMRLGKRLDRARADGRLSDADYNVLHNRLHNLISKASQYPHDDFRLRRQFDNSDRMITNAMNRHIASPHRDWY